MQALRGRITEFNLWSYALDMQTISNIKNCASTIKGNMIAWSRQSLEVYGATTIDIDHQDICFPRRKILLARDKMSYGVAKTFCHVHAGHLFTPTSEAENLKLVKLVNANSESCSSSGGYLAWLGIERNKDGDWIDPKDSLANNFNHFDGANQSNKFAIFRIDGSWEDTSAKARTKLCFACGFNKEPIYTLKGICHQSIYDFNYYIEDKDDVISGYVGYKGSFLTRNKSAEQSTLQNRIGETSIIKVVCHEDLDIFYPIFFQSVPSDQTLLFVTKGCFSQIALKISKNLVHKL